MSQEQDKAFFRNFSLVVGVLAVLMIIFIFAARIVGFDEKTDMAHKEAVAAKTTAPMGEVKVAAAAQDTAPAPAPAAAPEAVPATAGADGKKIYDSLCTSCHGTGIPGVPQLGDKAAWEPRVAQGKDTLYKNAIEGFTGASGMMMPPRGGGANSDDEVKAAVDFIIASVQAGEATPAAGAAAAPAGADGKKIYDSLCTSCHGTGLPGVPQLGDKAAWEPRIAQGNDTLYKHAIEGFTGASGMMMPPRGGGASSDDEVKAAVDYMTTNSQ